MPGKVRGLDEVNRQMAKKVGEIKGQMTRDTLLKIVIAGEQYAVALTPVDTGNLINSRYRAESNTATGASMRVGYTAWYAAIVHELPGTLKGQPRAHFGKTRDGVEFGGGTEKGRYWDPDAEPQFLKKGFERDGRADIEAIIKVGYK